MEWLHKILGQVDPLYFIYGGIAMFGGIARYLSNYSRNGEFNFPVLVASMFVSGFSGWMFAVMGQSLALPETMIFIMAGTGGFFGDQTMKLIMDYIKLKAQ